MKDNSFIIHGFLRVFSGQRKPALKIFTLLCTTMLIGLTLLQASCSSDDDLEETVRYRLIINNKTSENVDVFLNSDLSNSGFVSEGTVLAGQQKIINNLIIKANYTLRASIQGNGLDDFFDEQTFSNNTEADLSIDITN